MPYKKPVKRTSTPTQRITGNPPVTPYGLQPDGDLVPMRTGGNFFQESVSLAAGEVFTSEWYDTDGFSQIELFVSSNVPSAQFGIKVEFTDDTQATTPAVQAVRYFNYTETQVRLGDYEYDFPPILDGFRVSYTNGSEGQTSLYISAEGRMSVSSRTNFANALVVEDFAREVALGTVSNYSQENKFGRNAEIDSGQPADIWDGGTNTLGLHEYTGFNATSEETLSIVSTSVADVGTLVSSGTVTTTAENEIIDSTATFVSDGVAAGDVVLNDTRGISGIITSVDSETQVSVFKMNDSSVGQYDNIIGNAYRVVTASGTGAAVIAIKRILNSNYEKQKTVFAIMNGTTPVSVAVSAMRCSRGTVQLAGSGGANAGIITLNQAVTTANVFWKMAVGANQTLVCCDTVPRGSIFLVQKIYAAIGLASPTGATGSISLRVRAYGTTFQSKRVYELATNGASLIDEELGGVALTEGTDFKLRVDTVSTSNVRASGKIQYLEILEVIA